MSIEKKQIKELIKNKFNIINDNSKIKINIKDVNKFLNENNLTKEDIIKYIKNEKKDTYTIQLQENFNSLLNNNGVNQKYIPKNFKDIVENNDIKNMLEDTNNKINNYDNSLNYYIKRFTYDYIINLNNKNINNIFKINKISLSKINSALYKYLKNNYFEYNSELINFKNIIDFNNYIYYNYNYNIIDNIIIISDFEKIKLTFSERDTSLYKKRLKFIRDIKNSIITKNVNNIAKYKNIFEFKMLSIEHYNKTY